MWIVRDHYNRGLKCKGSLQCVANKKSKGSLGQTKNIRDHCRKQKMLGITVMGGLTCKGSLSHTKNVRDHCNDRNKKM